jgi:hypothetical protein
MLMKSHLVCDSAALLLAGSLTAAGLPNPLATATGQEVTTAAAWQEKVRPQTLQQFREQVYGVRPVEKPAEFHAKVVREDAQALAGTATLKEIEITFTGPNGPGKIHPVLLIPNTAKPPVPTFLLFGFTKPDPLAESNISGGWPVREILARGYASVAFQVSEVDPDRADGFGGGVRALFGAQPRAADAWGALSAWGWGASRIMDYLETDAAIDAKRVAAIGHSRCGKAALWCAAEDPRFSYVISNNSGCGGAAMARTKKGERVVDITTRFPYWFCENYQKYRNHEENLPVDQHQLLGLIAPRLLYVASATQDDWADGESEFEACVRASPVYALFGKTGLASPALPKPDQALLDGSIGYHMRTGKHALTVSDWQHFMDFADKHWKP